MQAWLRSSAVALGTLAACGGPGEEPVRPPQVPAADRVGIAPVGGATCSRCHAEQAERWRGSHHDLSMQEAGAGSVLGDFDDAELAHFSRTSRFFRRGEAFIVRTDGPDGELGEFPVEYAFGVEPLQQYLVRLPGGRLQALPFAWDSRPPAAGGQRWLHLHPETPLGPDDPLHWTGPAYRWDSMCADCHSTFVRRLTHAEPVRFETTWSEVDVSCEACHGPGSAHVAWAEGGAKASDATSGLTVDLRRDGRWVFDAGRPIARRDPPGGPPREIETCAPCHARRSAVAPGADPARPFLDGYRPALLEAGLYHDDGQIRDEVFVWGSFLQSRMYAAGVTCSDCHDPHGLRLPDGPDAACAKCHRPEVFASPAHHHHREDSEGSSCVACHMPATTYMRVDPRRDHGFRVPRPDLSASLGVPNACANCHAERPAAWAAAATATWGGAGRRTERHYGEVLHAARRGAADAGRDLARLARDAREPEIVRATALRELPGRAPPAELEAAIRALRDDAPLLRMAAADAGAALAAERRLPALRPLLADPVRAVRIEAARALADLPPQLWRAGERAALARGLDEYRAAQETNPGRAESHVNLGVLHALFGERAAARREYETALHLNPSFLPALVNLADLDRLEGRDEEGERRLGRALEIAPDNADVHHALGLLRVRQGRADLALRSLERAAALAPDQSRHAYVLGVALHSLGRSDEGVAVLEGAHRAHPGDPELLLALATIHRDRGEEEAALHYARVWTELDPGEPRARALLRELEAADRSDGAG